MALYVGTGGLTIAQRDSSPVASGSAMTIACWLYPDANNVQETPIAVWSEGGGNFHRLGIDLRGDSGPQIRGIHKGTSFTSAIINVTYPAGWFHVCLSSASASDRTIYYNGSGTKANTTTSAGTFDTFDQVDINHYQYDGRIAEVGVWSAVLDDAEVDALAAGMPCSHVRPASLVTYLPLTRGKVVDRIYGDWGTVTGTETQNDHPRIIYPKSRSIFIPPVRRSSLTLLGVG